MNNKYKNIAQEILQKIGGKENVKEANFCATRLRLTLKNTDNIDEDSLKNIPGVVGVVTRNNNYQFIVGTDVTNIYSAFINLVEMEANEQLDVVIDETALETEPKNWFVDIVDFISGTFVPVLPILVAAGLVSAVLNIATTFMGLSADSGTVIILNGINSAGFYFLPVYIGFSAARKLNINPFMGAFLGAILLTSTINGVDGLDFLGISVPMISYENSVIPIILGVLFMAFIYKTLDKVVPKEINYFINPLVAILIATPVTLIILGPLGNVLGSWLASGLGWVNTKLGWLSVGIIGAVTPLLVMTGTNQALFPLVFAGMADFGYEAFVMPGMLAANVAVGAAALATFVVSKKNDTKALALSSGLTGVMGITEPAIFGVLLRFRKPFFGAMIGGGIAGLFAGIVNLKQYAVVSPGLAALPTFIPTDGSGAMGNFWLAVVTLVLAVLISFIATYILLKKDKNFK